MENKITEKEIDNLTIIKNKFKNKTELKEYINENPNKALKLYNDYFKADTEMSVNMNGLFKVYDNGIQAISNLKLDIASKEFICLLGPSGCGKTTLLRMIAGLETISVGLLSFNDNVVNSTIPSKRGLSMVFQNYALYPYMSVYKNISFGLKIESKNNKHIHYLKKIIKNSRNLNTFKINELKSGMRILKKPFEYEIEVSKEKMHVFKFQSKKSEYKNLKRKILNLKKKQKSEFSKNLIKFKNIKRQMKTLKKEGSIKNSEIEKQKIRDLKIAIKLLKILAIQTIDKRVKNVCKTVGISNYLNRKPSELSGGQRQRVALARTISKSRKLFLFDEPLSNLDAKLRADMRILIKKLHRKLGSTSIYVTHDQIEAMTMADRVVIMNLGYIQQVDTPINLFLNPSNLFVAKFVGTPEINIIEGFLDKDSIIRIGETQLKIIKSNIINRPTSKSGKNVYFAIRPQHIITNLDIVDKQKENIIRAKIINIQLLGNEYLLTISHSDLGKFDVNVSSYLKPQMNFPIDCYINPNKIILFDKTSELNLTTKINEETLVSIENWFSGAKDRFKNESIMQKELDKKSIIKKISTNFKNKSVHQ